MEIDKLVGQIMKKRSFLCVGLDVDLGKIPESLQLEPDPIFAFNKAIIDATHQYAVAYKPNTAFYEAYSESGWAALKKTIDYLNQKYPDLFTIADAKRGDIGNTSRMYANAFFEEMGFDSVTVAPYMGKDSVEPFLEFQDKHTILLALTSNEGANDFQTKLSGEQKLYEHVIRESTNWINASNLMYVVGATKAEYLAEIRQLIPDSFLLIPGVGAQGGSLEAVCKYGMNPSVGLLVNSSRGIIYASGSDDFAEAASDAARSLQQQMGSILDSYYNNS